LPMAYGRGSLSRRRRKYGRMAVIIPYLKVP
jgi:hypothetical protein